MYRVFTADEVDVIEEYLGRLRDVITITPPAAWNVELLNRAIVDLPQLLDYLRICMIGGMQDSAFDHYLNCEKVGAHDGPVPEWRDDCAQDVYERHRMMLNGAAETLGLSLRTEEASNATT